MFVSKYCPTEFDKIIIDSDFRTYYFKLLKLVIIQSKTWLPTSVVYSVILCFSFEQ